MSFGKNERSLGNRVETVNGVEADAKYRNMREICQA